MRAGTVASVEDLMSTVWKGVVVSDGSVYLAISQLRQALDDPDSGASYIETVPKRGYRLTVPVETISPRRGPRSSGAGFSPRLGEAGARVARWWPSSGGRADVDAALDSRPITPSPYCHSPIFPRKATRPILPTVSPRKS